MMQKHWERRKSGEGGFTLVELLVVIAILGILAAIVTFAVSGITDKGEKSACDADEKTVEVAVEAFRAQNTDYPADTAALLGSGLLRGNALPDGITYAAGGVVNRVGDCA
jgi:prepilin-type N-terminal cleavage/methylation domain-containing protein